MPTFPWPGVNTHIVSVGKTKLARYQSVQKALDSITDSAAENPYLVDVWPGIYDEAITLVKSHVAVRGRSRHASIIRNPSSGSFAFQIGDAAGLTEHVSVENIRVVQVPSSSPGPAIAVGPYVTYSTVLNWDNVRIRDVDVDGNHDGIQAFGQTSAVTTPGLLSLQGCHVRCAHDAVALKGNARIRSIGNLIVVDSSSVPPYITSGISAWKTTGFHFNFTQTPTSVACVFDSVGDQIYIKGAGNSGGVAAQRTLTGILYYNSVTVQAGSGVYVPHSQIHGIKIFIESDFDYAANTIDNGIAGINLYGAMDVPDERVVISNFRIRVDQKNAGAGGNTPDVHGIRLRTYNNDGATATVRAIHGSISGTNAAAGKTAYCLTTVGANDTIKHGSLFSDLAKSPGTGNITALTAVA